MIKELENHDNAILFIDEIHTVIGAGATSGGAMDASNLLKPALASGTLRCMGSTTYKEFRQHFEKDRALVRRFQKIDVNEPTVEDTIKILKGLKSYYEEFHKLKYTDRGHQGGGGAVGQVHHRPQAAGQGDRRHRRGRRLADAADREPAARRSSASRKSRPWSAKIARIPPKSVSKSDTESLRQLETDLKGAVFGQDEAIESAVVGDEDGARRPARRQQADRLLPVLRPHRHRQDRDGAPAGAHPRHRAPALRHERIHGAPHGEPPDRRASRLCRASTRAAC